MRKLVYILPALLALSLVLFSCGKESYEDVMAQGRKFYFANENFQTDNAALEFFRQASKIDKKAAEPQYYIGRVFARQTLYPQAMEYFNRAIELDPTLADAYYRRALCRVVGEQAISKETRLDLKQTLRYNPDHTGAKNMLTIYKGMKKMGS